jgi:hypothetical protein
MGCACQQRKTSFLPLFPPKYAEKHISSQQILNRNPIYPLEKGISGKFTLIFDARAISRLALVQYIEYRLRNQALETAIQDYGCP